MNIDDTVFDDQEDMDQALYACWWGNDFVEGEKLELNSFSFFTEDIGYSLENIAEIATLTIRDTTCGDWPENHYIMRVK